MHNFNIHSSYEGLNMVEVYSRYGSFQNVTHHPTAWSKISDDDLVVVGNGFGRETPLPFGSFEPLQISAGRTQSFYIAIINGRFMQHTLSSSMVTGDVYVSTDALSLKVGVSKNYDFFDTHHNVIWNGRIMYSLSGQQESRLTDRYISSTTSVYGSNSVFCTMVASLLVLSLVNTWFK